MYIVDCVSVPGSGGFFWDDQAAIKRGLKANGFTYHGKPETPGFYAIRQPSEAITIVFFLDDGQMAYGDCAAVQYAARSGRDPLFSASLYKKIIDEVVFPQLKGFPVTSFRDGAEFLDNLQVNQQRIHRSIRYGLTQAMADAVAKWKGITIAEMLCQEYDLTLAQEPVPIFCQSGDSWYPVVDRMILRRVDIFPHGLVNTVEKVEQLAQYISWIQQRIHQLGGEDYRPRLHFDVYGTLGLYCHNQLEKMLKHLEEWEERAKPYQLTIEEPFDVEGQEETMELMAKLIAEKNRRGLTVNICADEWCNTYEEVVDFVKNGACDMVQIKTPDLGGINNSIAAVQYCKAHHVQTYLGGSCAETVRSAQVSCHMALATNPTQVLAKPGMGVDESHHLTKNEMAMVLAIAAKRAQMEKKNEKI